LAPIAELSLELRKETETLIAIEQVLLFIDFLIVNVRQLLSMQQEMQHQHLGNADGAVMYRFMYYSHENGPCTQH